LALKLLHQVEFQVGTAGHFEDFEQRAQSDVMLHRLLARSKVRDLFKKVFEAQERAHAFAERIFVGNHATAARMDFVNCRAMATKPQSPRAKILLFA
jgi:hypothetical protein